jgi:hypothetical protein
VVANAMQLQNLFVRCAPWINQHIDYKAFKTGQWEYLLAFICPAADPSLLPVFWGCTDEKKIKFSSYIKKFKKEQLQSHI